MTYKITVTNGSYPLAYECQTIHDAYMCIETLSVGLLSDKEIDLDSVMETLVDMRRGTALSSSAAWYGIQAIREEAINHD